jgi:Family of unknown function (DUF5681)
MSDDSLEPEEPFSENTEKRTDPVPSNGEVISPGRARSMANLKPWQKGKSANPGGRPKRGPLTDALALIADKKTPEELLQKIPPSIAKVLGKKPTLAQVLMFRLMYMAIAGDVGATRLIFERLEGKVREDVQQTDTGKLDQLMEVLALGGMPSGHVNEGADDE